MGEVLTKDKILAAEDRAAERVKVPEWGGDVYVRIMSGAERDQWELWCMKNAADPQNVRAYLAVLTVVDEAGNNLFSFKDVEALGRKSAAALDRIFETAQRLNSLNAADIETLEKN